MFKYRKYRILGIVGLLFIFLLNSFTLIGNATDPPISKIGTADKSYPHIHDKPGEWNPVSIDGYFIRSDTNQLRANWHSKRAPGVELGGIGYDSPTGYIPPKGKIIHSILRYPVYEMRTYDVQKEKSGCDGGLQTDDKCNPFYFDGVAGEDNRWAKEGNIEKKEHWAFYGYAYRDNEVLGIPNMLYYRFRTAKLRVQGDDGLGHGGTPWYKYDFKIMDDPNARGLRIEPPSQTIKVGETATYKAIYSALDGKEYDKTLDKLSTWSIADTSLASSSTKGKFVGKKLGTTTVKVDYGSLSATATLKVVAADPPEEPEEPKENLPPLANLFVEPEYYWPETVTFQDNSTDPDGEIVSRELTVDGSPSNFSRNFPRVTAEETHDAALKVTDDAGASDTDARSFKILPTTPTAMLEINGTLKENRKVSFNAHGSDKATKAIRVAPINYNLTTWDFKPVTPGITQGDIKIEHTSDGGIKDVLFKKAGEYEVTITVTNKYSEVSEPYTAKITIMPDEKPIAKFTVDQKVALRDGTTKKATIELKDFSNSIDDDFIKQRIWYVEYDSNNDGLFGTAMDTSRQVISSGNETTVYYETDRVGHYRFTLEVVEGFGQPTLQRFINDGDYRRDVTEKIDSGDRVSEYTKLTNFNIIDKDKAVEVSNTPPVVDFGMQTHRKVDLVLDIGGLTKATQQHMTGNRPGGTSNNDGGGYYDHKYYTYDYSERNEVASLAASLETDLKTKGIDARVVIDNDYYHLYDTDGTCIKSIPQWGWSTYYRTIQTTASNTVSNYSSSPPGGSYSPPAGYSITSTVHTGSYQNTSNYTVVGSGSFSSAAEADAYPVGRDSRICSWNADNTVYSCTFIRYQWVHSYTYYLEKQEPYQVWEVQYYYNQGCNSTEQTDPTRMKDNFVSQTYRSNTDVVYARFDNQSWTWVNDTSQVNPIVSKMRQDNPFFWHFAYNSNRANFDRFTTTAATLGKFSLYDFLYKGRNVQDIKDYIIGQYLVTNPGENHTILLGEEIAYSVTYEDFENDPELAREWKFSHDPTKVNGRTIDNQHSKIAQSDHWVSAPLQLKAAGTYKIQLRSKDNPVHFGDNRFNNYQKWSDEEIVREYTVNVHRRPIADFTFNIDAADNYRLDLDPKPSYDPEHQFNRDDKGIVEYEWTSYMVDGVKYNGAPPSNLQVNKIYDVTLQVKDIDGAYGSTTKRISTMGMNQKPIALFDAPDVVYRNQPLNIVDRSYDPDGDPLTNYQFTIRKQGSSTILKTLSTFPKNFAELGLGEGTYTMGLTVDDIPKTGPSLRSELYERNIKVILDNNPPTSVFSLTPNPIQLGLNQVATYKDSSYDIDGHPLINYSWKINKVDENGNVINSWETGVPPTDFSQYGVGTYEVYQTVFDDPPAPLPSLSDTSMVRIEVIIGKQKPFALIDWSPKLPIEGDIITLDPSKSFDLDGTVEKWEWEITNPAGQKTSSTAKNPIITNAIKGDYKVQLHVYDNDNLRSEVPAIQVISVKEKPPNEIPVASFTWSPLQLTYGDTVKFNPDNSYDPDGEVVAWNWTFEDLSGNVTSSTQQYPEFPTNSFRYKVSLVVTDNEGAKSEIVTQYVFVNPVLEPLVYHTPEWEEIRIKNNRPFKLFYAGEKFLIRLTTSPAESVSGTVDFGGSIGPVEIPTTLFTKVNVVGTIWEAELWREDFAYIPEGQYYFEFKSVHDAGSEKVFAEGLYDVTIDSNIYEALNFHRNH